VKFRYIWAEVRKHEDEWQEILDGLFSEKNKVKYGRGVDAYKLAVPETFAKLGFMVAVLYISNTLNELTALTPPPPPNLVVPFAANSEGAKVAQKRVVNFAQIANEILKNFKVAGAGWLVRKSFPNKNQK